MSAALNLTGTGAAYIRVSTDQQETVRQHDSVKSFQTRHDVTIAPQHLFADEGWTRDEADRRPEFQKLMKLAEAGAVHWIVVDQLDRFGTKDAHQLVAYLYRLREAGCRLFDAAGKEWTGADIATIITAVVEGEKSKGEQAAKSHRALGGKVALARAGEWQGGPVRLGTDVVCYNRATGAEVWRVVIEGLHKRLKVFPDGREERFDGEGNFPKFQDKVEVLRLAPSIRRERIDAAVSVFQRFATESVSPSALAHHLNKLGFRTAHGGHFNGCHVVALLEDPIYIGYYTYNRKHYGKFNRYTGGQIVPELNYEERQSRNARADWVQSQRLFEPLVGVETWNAVQRKLDRPKRESAPRSAALYLGGLVFCGNCGSRMIAGRAKSEKVGNRRLRFEFCCGGYHKAIRFKTRDCNTCLRNALWQEEIEPYIECWLKETGKRLDLLTRAPDDGALTGPLRKQVGDAWGAFRDGIVRLARYLSEHHPDEYAVIVRRDGAQHAADQAELANPSALPTGTLSRVIGDRGCEALARHKAGDPPGHDEFVAECLACYRQHFDPSGLAAEVEKEEFALKELMDGWRTLPNIPLVRARAEAELAAKAARIEELQRQQQDAAGVVEHHYRELHDLQRALADARLALKSESGERALRQRAEALRGVIQRIECTFTVTGQAGGGRGRKNTRLARVTIYPVAGDPGHFSADNLLRPTRATSHM